MNIDKAKDVASQASEKATEVAGDLAERVGPAAEKAGQYAAKGVEYAADAANKVTGGRFEEQISSAADKVEGVLDKNHDDQSGQ